MNHAKQSTPACGLAARATLDAVARACGVSRRLVAAVLNNEQSATIRASAATRARIRAAAARLAYRPNRSARNIRAGRHGALGLLIGDVTLIRPHELQLMIEAAQQRDCLLVIEHVPGPGVLPKLLREACVDGLFLFQSMDHALSRAAQQARVPLVQINTNERAGRGCITYDEDGGMARAVRLLRARRRQRVALLIGDRAPLHYSDRERPRALRRVARAAGMAEPLVARANDAAAAYAAARALLRRQPALDAFILHADCLAPGVWHALAETGRMIPRDVSVLSFYRTAFAGALAPPLTTLHIEPARLVRAAYRMMDALLHGRRTGIAPVVLPYTLVRGSSV